MARIISKAQTPAAFNLGEKVKIDLMGRYQSKGGNRESEKENREKRDAQQCMIVDIRLGQDGQHVYGVAYQNGPIAERNVPEGRLCFSQLVMDEIVSLTSSVFIDADSIVAGFRKSSRRYGTKKAGGGQGVVMYLRIVGPCLLLLNPIGLRPAEHSLPCMTIDSTQYHNNTAANVISLGYGNNHPRTVQSAVLNEVMLIETSHGNVRLR
ncbi:hypothetical protein IWZ01DRAFT_479397 [Phyllosticta capitalensis]